MATIPSSREVKRRLTDPRQSTQAADQPGAPVASRLLGTAARLFWRYGYAATSTRALSEGLGVQKASLYYYVKKKEDLLYAICVNALSNILSRAREEVAKIESPRGRVEAVIRGHLIGMLEDKDAHATMLTELRSLSPGRRREIIALRDEYDSFIERVIRDGQEAGILRRDISAAMLRLGLLDLLNWAIFWFDDHGELDSSSLASTFASLYLDGAMRDPAPGERFGGASLSGSVLTTDA
jgi:TetR/AcrR family transcriptional regulator, cholesterol catabolism regulator